MEPDNITIHEGETALLKCEVDNPSGIVQWVKDGLLLGPDQNIPRFPRYSMVGDPNKVNIPHCAFFSIAVPPKRLLIMEYEANSIVTWVAGMEYTVHCQVNNARPPAEIAFSMGDKDLTDVTSDVQPGSSDKLFSTEATLRWKDSEFFPKTHSQFSFRITPRSSDNRQRLTCRASNAVALIPVIVGFTMNILYYVLNSEL
ncbi:hypothetical protein JD844_005612 [Phrynosoma platyrhinos]|uniref:Ig-like domain-containing protein n=1 Tax=Phrynosoma platyrhinos TaxID=52577 RepID=A0ABQ7TPA7_PHRPL|nr:hypothetical protein JD844_005612 [Phrynosoma platyrhinos]